MAFWDWLIVGIYISIAVSVGLYFTKKASASTTNFFVAGRTLPWFIAGTSIVATTFSADTPLFIAGMSRDIGIWKNWFWWSAAIGNIFTIFFFARYWRRTEVLTDIEFVAIRYQPSKVVSILRVFKVFFDGLLLGCAQMASVTLAMIKILKVLLNLNDTPLFNVPFFGDINSTILTLIILGVAVVIYTTLSGLYGVAYLDFIQFSLAMIGSIGLAAVVYFQASSGPGFMAKLQAVPEFNSKLISFFPTFKLSELAAFTFFIYIFMLWWQAAPGSGYTVQRILATRSEKDSLLAFLWFCICHYIIRPWSWIIVGLLSLIYFPKLPDSETAFPVMINKFLPIGFKGIMVASLFAAYMSTIDTLLNWVTSYLINDLYRPFIAADKSNRHYVTASRIGMVFLTVIALIVTTKLTSIFNTYKYLWVILSGVGTIMIARWYWWRVNAYSEICAIASAAIIGTCCVILLPSTPEKDLFGFHVLITTIAVTIIWITVTLLTAKSTPDEQTIEFYKKMKINSFGWRKVAAITNIQPTKGEFSQNLIAWITCIIFVYSLLLSAGKFIFHQWLYGIICLAIGIISGFMLFKCIRKMKFD